MKLDIVSRDRWGVSTGENLLIAGPCSVESEEQISRTARGLAAYDIGLLRGGIWKPRTHPDSFAGLGEPALKWLKAAGDAVNIPVTTEIALPEHLEACLKHGVDVVWIGARTTSNPFAVQALADALKGVDIPVMVKNPINPDIELWMGAFERLNAAGVTKLAAIHRGFSTYKKDKYRNPPIWTIPIELKRMEPNMPIICDPSHMTGKAEMVEYAAQAAMDLLYEGLMIEVHIDPGSALSDAQQQLTPEQFGTMMKRFKVKKSDTLNQDYLARIGCLREEIDQIDESIIKLLAERMETSREIGIFKSKNTVATFQPKRWSEVVDRITKIAGELGLSEDFILNLYRGIHEESIRQQQLIQAEATAAEIASRITT